MKDSDGDMDEGIGGWLGMVSDQSYYITNYYIIVIYILKEKTGMKGWCWWCGNCCMCVCWETEKERVGKRRE